jgi:hypothetical protein
MKLNLTKEQVDLPIYENVTEMYMMRIKKDWLTMHAELARLNATIRLLREDAERLVQAELSEDQSFIDALWKHNALIKQLDKQEKK